MISTIPPQNDHYTNNPYYFDNVNNQYYIKVVRIASMCIMQEPFFFFFFLLVINHIRVAFSKRHTVLHSPFTISFTVLKGDCSINSHVLFCI